jgi:hypothetical protein
MPEMPTAAEAVVACDGHPLIYGWEIAALNQGEIHRASILFISG